MLDEILRRGVLFFRDLNTTLFLVKLILEIRYLFSIFEIPEEDFVRVTSPDGASPLITLVQINRKNFNFMMLDKYKKNN